MSANGFADLVREAGARDVSVFINCPFDAAYAELRDALVFSTVCCGLLPRSAADLGHVSTPRVERILAAISACRYSIHDLSRCTGEGDLNLARFNMPLELGMAMVHRHNPGVPDHDWLALVPEGHGYMRFASDLAGYDPHAHDETPESVARAVTAWLWTLPNAVAVHRPDAVCRALPSFTALRQQLDIEFSGVAPWSAVYEAASMSVPGLNAC